MRGAAGWLAGSLLLGCCLACCAVRRQRRATAAALLLAAVALLAAAHTHRRRWDDSRLYDKPPDSKDVSFLRRQFFCDCPCVSQRGVHLPRLAQRERTRQAPSCRSRGRSARARPPGNRQCRVLLSEHCSQLAPGIAAATGSSSRSAGSAAWGPGGPRPPPPLVPTSCSQSRSSVRRRRTRPCCSRRSAKGCAARHVCISCAHG